MRSDGGARVGVGQGRGAGGMPGGVLGGTWGVLKNAGIKQKARELEIVKSVDLNSKMELIALTDRWSPSINHN